MTEDESIKAFARFRMSLSKGKRPKKYPYPLSEPIYVDEKQWPAEIASGGKVAKLVPKAKREYRDAIYRRVTTRWNLLFILYDIEPNDWEGLARELAAQHVPGFQTTNTPPKAAKRAGRPSKYDDPVKIISHVENLEAKQREMAKNKGRVVPLTEAARALVGTKAAASHLARYYEFKDIMKRAAARPIKDGMSLARLDTVYPTKTPGK
ncbi:hypothetical protein [Bradyrhizobium sp. G127]|uniref:hypothetical protein n=1 Tax=Bradyrhizobium sp. G127 TaxID=2904800 RepID=UPI001F317A02|nr:hypothetical protein [Bradyrhizobium sp. G127]MCF2523902.1 hypothetical protein [Bradyrhizobium sp. G127]